MPAVLLGRLARHQDLAGRELGAVLPFGAIATVASAPIGAHALFADAIDDRTAGFCRRFGFVPLLGQPNRLYLPLATASRLLGRASS